jgi:hypothetical protein
MGGHVLRETTSRGLCGLGCPSRTSERGGSGVGVGVCVFITAGPSTKLFTWGGGGDMGGHVLRETTSRGLCGLGCPSSTSERGGEGDCVKEGAGGGGEMRRRCVLLLQDLLQSCSRGGRRRVEDMCYERRRAEACVDESAHHAQVCVFITAGPIIKLCAGGEGDSEGHVL